MPDAQLSSFVGLIRRPTHPPRVKGKDDEDVHGQSEYDVQNWHEQHGFLKDHRLKQDLHGEKQRKIDHRQSGEHNLFGQTKFENVVCQTEQGRDGGDQRDSIRYEAFHIAVGRVRKVRRHQQKIQLRRDLKRWWDRRHRTQQSRGSGGLYDIHRWSY